MSDAETLERKGLLPAQPQSFLERDGISDIGPAEKIFERSRGRRWAAVTIVAIISFCLGCLVSLTSVDFGRHTRHMHEGAKPGWEEATVWSPMSPAVEFEDANFVNYFAHKSEYRGPPNPAIERAWERLLRFDPIGIHGTYLQLLNRSSNEPLMKTTHPGHEGEYVVAFEVFHQLHCLNTIRQYTWRNHYTVLPAALDGNDVANRMHVDHCIETLRLSLMCNADLTPFTLPIGEHSRVRADFDAFHRCKKWDPLVNWMTSNSWEPFSDPPLLPESNFRKPLRNEHSRAGR